MDDRLKTRWNRRRFLQGMALTPAALLINESLAKAAEDVTATGPRRIPVLQNWTDSTGAIVTVMGRPGWNFIANQPDLSIQTSSKFLSYTGRVMYRLDIQGLTTSELRSFTILDSDGKTLDVRSLKGLDLEMPQPNVAVISCADYRKKGLQKAIWSRVIEQKVDLMLGIGDMVYSNSQWSSVTKKPEPPGPALGRYIQTWETVELYQFEPLVPMLAVWDDHDFGQNNGDGTNPYKFDMLDIFRTFYPLPESHPNLSLGAGASFRVTAFGLDIHMLDDRTFCQKGVTQWGDEQEKWFFDEFANSGNPAWVVNGILYYGHAPFNESVQTKTPATFARLQDLIKTIRKPTILFSGDVHCSQVQKLNVDDFGFQTYEITSSAIHSTSAHDVLKRCEADGQLFYYGTENFLTFKPVLSAGRMQMNGTCVTVSDLLPLPEMTVEV